MPTVVGIAFSRPGKTYYFDPGDLELSIGDRVIVKTSNGNDLGEVLTSPRQIADEELVAPLKPVVRLASDKDLERAESSRERIPEIMAAASKKIAEAKLPMQLVSTELSYDGGRVTIFFSAESRVDFRQLVRDLSSDLKARIELRQVGVRDAARQIGGCGPCGQQLCCSRFLTDFAPVSVRMAKDQDLPLNPSKISGSCGRLLCCLRYEHEVYVDFHKRAPKRGSTVETEEGPARVIDLRAAKEAVLLQYENGTAVETKLRDLEGKGCSGCGSGSCSCGHRSKEQSSDERAVVAAAVSVEAPVADAVEAGRPRPALREGQSASSPGQRPQGQRPSGSQRHQGGQTPTQEQRSGPGQRIKPGPQGQGSQGQGQQQANPASATEAEGVASPDGGRPGGNSRRRRRRRKRSST